MSNVLIGIVAVVLFIGLALVGVTYFGDQFKDQKAKSKAAAVVQQMSQIRGAIQLWRMQVSPAQVFGGSISGNILITSGYLADTPVNPINPNDPSNGGLYYYGHSASFGFFSGIPQNDMVATDLGSSDLARKACELIQLQGRHTTTVPTLSSFNISSEVNNGIYGCFLADYDYNISASGSYIAWTKTS